MNKHIEKMISSYIEGDISEKDKEIIENYIKNNKEFKLKIDNIKNIIASLNDTPSITTSKHFLSKLDEKISNSDSNTRSYWFNKNVQLGFGFSFILIIAGFFIFSDSDVDNSDFGFSNNGGGNFKPLSMVKKDSMQNKKDSTLNMNDDFKINQAGFNK